MADQDADRNTPGSGLLRGLLKEPLVHFLALAGLLFGLQAIFAGDTREVISVDADTQEYLFQQRQDLTLRPVSDEEKQQIIEDFVEEEILVREANKRGFADGSRIRRPNVKSSSPKALASAPSFSFSASPSGTVAGSAKNM